MISDGDWEIENLVASINMYGEWVSEYENRKFWSVQNVLSRTLYFLTTLMIPFCLVACVLDFLRHDWLFGGVMVFLFFVNVYNGRSNRKTRRQERTRIEGYREKVRIAQRKLAYLDPTHPLLPLLIEEEP